MPETLKDSKAHLQCEACSSYAEANVKLGSPHSHDLILFQLSNTNGSKVSREVSKKRITPSKKDGARSGRDAALAPDDAAHHHHHTRASSNSNNINNNNTKRRGRISPRCISRGDSDDFDDAQSPLRFPTRPRPWAPPRITALSPLSDKAYGEETEASRSATRSSTNSDNSGCSEKAVSGDIHVCTAVHCSDTNGKLYSPRLHVPVHEEAARCVKVPPTCAPAASHHRTGAPSRPPSELESLRDVPCDSLLAYGLCEEAEAGACPLNHDVGLLRAMFPDAEGLRPGATVSRRLALAQMRERGAALTRCERDIVRWGANPYEDDDLEAHGSGNDDETAAWGDDSEGSGSFEVRSDNTTTSSSARFSFGTLRESQSFRASGFSFDKRVGHSTRTDANTDSNTKGDGACRNEYLSQVSKDLCDLRSQVKPCHRHFYTQRGCPNGEMCHFSHDRYAVRNTDCSRYLNSKCPLGDNCPMRHDPVRRRRVPCQFYLQGDCRLGHRCPRNHDDAELRLLMPNTPIHNSRRDVTSTTNTGTCCENVPNNNFRWEGTSDEWGDCSICLCPVMYGRTPHNNNINTNHNTNHNNDAPEECGQLSCGHVFHVNCILKWLETNHTCPLCRVRAYLESLPKNV